MSAQTSYEINQPVAYAGLVYALAPSDIVSRSVMNESGDGIPFGVAVSRGDDLDRQVYPGGDDFTGITIRSLDREGAANSGAIEYKNDETAGVLRDGYIWAVCPTGCLPGDLVKYTDLTGVLDSGVAGVGETQLDDAQWDTTAAAGSLAVIRLNSLGFTAGGG